MNRLNDLRRVSESLATTDQMPVLFLGHGSPMNAIEENQFVDGFRSLARTLPKPKTILCVSAHWYTRGTRVTAMEMPRTIHDFSGFPKELYAVQYPAKGDPVLAKTAQHLLTSTVVELDQRWGLDHGTWSVVKHLYPLADIPVIQLSLDYTQPASSHYELAKQLNPLRHKGVLIIGSGNIVHNLSLADFANFHKNDYGYDWAIEARATINQFLLDGNYSPLIQFEKQSRALQLAIPTPEHYLPLLYALGLQEPGEPLQLFNDSLLAGSLSMTSLRIG
jgi:4,5-DOPA dioxygenase extradiol